MDIHLDTSWCPVCDRLITPKKCIIDLVDDDSTPPVPPPSPTPTTNAASQPQQQQGNSQERPPASSNTRRRLGGGLLHGTGRVRPGGVVVGLRPNTARQQLPQTHPAFPHHQLFRPASSLPPEAKQRRVIDQSQTPLYCSDECRIRDLNLNPHPSVLNPAARSPPSSPTSPRLPPVPQNSLTRLSDAELVSDGESSVDEHLSSPQEDNTLPPIVPLPLHPRRASASVLAPKTPLKKSVEYDGGMMMAARRLQKFFFAPQQEKQQEQVPRFQPNQGFEVVEPQPAQEEQQELEPEKWEGLVYHFHDNPNREVLETRMKVTSVEALTHRAAKQQRNEGAVESAKVEEPVSPTPTPTPASSSTAKRRSPSSSSSAAPERSQSANELYAKCPLLALPRPGTIAPVRSTSLSAMPTTCTTYQMAMGSTAAEKPLPKDLGTGRSSPPPPPKVKRDRNAPRSLLAPGAEGKLVVPDVKVKPFSATVPRLSRTVSNTSVSSGRSGRSGKSGRSRRLGSVIEEDAGLTDEEMPPTHPRPPPAFKRRQTWTYDESSPTYPVIPPEPITHATKENFIVEEGKDFPNWPPLPINLYGGTDAVPPREHIEKHPFVCPRTGKKGWRVIRRLERVVIPERRRLFLFPNA